MSWFKKIFGSDTTIRMWDLLEDQAKLQVRTSEIVKDTYKQVIDIEKRSTLNSSKLLDLTLKVSDLEGRILLLESRDK
jgi:WD40 repeat protein